MATGGRAAAKFGEGAAMATATPGPRRERRGLTKASSPFVLTGTNGLERRYLALT